MVVVSMIIMSFYTLDKIYPQIRADLDARHRSEGTSTGMDPLAAK
jgi:Na+/melibiose symporter-like transporter